MIALHGVLYGTTSTGGGGFFGTVFGLKPGAAGASVLHTFGYASDGRSSLATLAAMGDTLYGTTQRGGAHGDGTLFRVERTGARYRVIYNFGASAADGMVPFSGVTPVAGMLYGVTAGGGRHNGAGTVFRIAPTGARYAVLHDFGAGMDGIEPSATLTQAADGALYGTTIYGGQYGCLLYVECGTIFRITIDGRERVLHSFGNGTDGAGPQASLLEVNGTLYGTTIEGGRYGECPNGHGVKLRCGTIFSIDATGQHYATLHGFGRKGGGRQPDGNLVNVGGTLYGTTVEGGTYGFGTLFDIDPYGANYHRLYSFGATPGDGEFPEGALAVIRGVIYGATVGGGTTGSGTIFSLTPAPYQR